MFFGPQSGKFAVVHDGLTAITHMFNWNIDSHSHTPETYYASNTKWGASRNPGVMDFTGNFSLFDGNYIVFPGDFFKCIEFFTAPTSGVYGNPGSTYCGQGIVESNVITWAWGPEQSLTQQINIAANGCLATRDRTLDDTNISTPAKMCGLKLQWTVEPTPSTWLEIENAQQAVLTMTASNPSFVNSSTGCCTHRRPGNIDWTLAVTYTDHRAFIIVRESPYSFRLFNTPTTFWELSYAIFGSVTGITADRQTGAIQTQVANFMMKAIEDETMGYIRPPGGNPSGVDDLWPPVPTLLTVPTVPTIGTAVQEGGAYNVDVTWTPESSGDATGYTIWASYDDIDFACVGCSVSSPYKDIGVPPTATSYPMYYKVSAFNAQGQGEFSESVTATVSNVP
jgi:hypothetical protein